MAAGAALKEEKPRKRLAVDAKRAESPIKPDEGGFALSPGQSERSERHPG